MSVEVLIELAKPDQNLRVTLGDVPMWAYLRVKPVFKDCLRSWLDHHNHTPDERERTDCRNGKRRHQPDWKITSKNEYAECEFTFILMCIFKSDYMWEWRCEARKVADERKVHSVFSANLVGGSHCGSRFVLLTSSSGRHWTTLPNKRLPYV